MLPWQLGEINCLILIFLLKSMFILFQVMNVFLWFMKAFQSLNLKL